jgi:SET domain-containing protein
MALLEDQLFTKISGVPGSGNGLFTREKITAETRIVEYKGDIKLHKDLTDGTYAYDIGKGYVIDAIDVKDGLAHFANDADGFNTITGLTNNCEFQQEGMYVYINATTDIAAGEEILVWYGENFWARQVRDENS